MWGKTIPIVELGRSRKGAGWQAERVALEDYPFKGRLADCDVPPWDYDNLWPADWVGVPDAPSATCDAPSDAAPSATCDAPSDAALSAPCDSPSDAALDLRIGENENGMYAFRLKFSLEERLKTRLHITADERYRAFIDNEFFAWGSERGDLNNWFFESYDVTFEPGKHILTVVVSAMHDMAAWAQVTLGTALLVACDDEKYTDLFSTGHADWQVTRLSGYTFVPWKHVWIGTGGHEKIDGREFPWDALKGDGDAWAPVKKLGEAAGRDTYIIKEGMRLLRPAMLPEMLLVPHPAPKTVFKEAYDCDVDELPQRIISSANATKDSASAADTSDINGCQIPSHSKVRFIIDLKRYCCDFPIVRVSGGKDASIYVSQIESLYGYETEQPEQPPISDLEQPADAEPEQTTDAELKQPLFLKGDRAAYLDKYFVGDNEIFITDGGERTFSTFWWRAGRFVQIAVETQDSPLTIEEVCFLETHYPFNFEVTFKTDDQRLMKYIDPCVRSLEMCAHETYMDCPFYEQLMYIGDTRLQVLTTAMISRDPRLARKAIEMFAEGMRNQTNMPNCAFPASSGKVIPSFCLWWVGMLCDYARENSVADMDDCNFACRDRGFIRKMLPAARMVLDAYGADRNADGVLLTPPGWDFVDWVKGDNTSWSYGAPLDVGGKCHAIFNFQYALICVEFARLEEWMGNPHLAAHRLNEARSVFEAADKAFWQQDKAAYSDDLYGRYYSEHAHILAGLSEFQTDQRKARCLDFIVSGAADNFVDIYYEHYLFEFFAHMNRSDLFLERMHDWDDCVEHNFTTTPEHFSPDTRSDCHAWGAHPIRHFITDLLGIRSASFGFERVTIKPAPCGLSKLCGSAAHPLGPISVEYRRLRTASGSASDPGSLAAPARYAARILLPPGLSGTFVLGDSETPLSSGITEMEFEI